MLNSPPLPRGTRAASLPLILLLFGCGQDLAPVSGYVRLDGAPLASATVTFLPDQGQPATALTDDQGRFTLNTNNEPGARAGVYRVLVVKEESLDTASPPADFGEGVAEATPEQFARGMAALGARTRRSLLPDHYGQQDQTPLRVEVPAAGREDLTLELVSAPISEESP